MYCDNQSTIHLTGNQVFYNGSKHIDVKLYFIKDIVSGKLIKTQKMAIEENPTDMLTKFLPMPRKDFNGK